MLVQLLRFIIDMYSAVLLSADPEIKAEPVLKKFDELNRTVSEQVDLTESLLQLQSQIGMLQMLSSISQ